MDGRLSEDKEAEQQWKGENGELKVNQARLFEWRKDSDVRSEDCDVGALGRNHGAAEDTKRRE